ncbi:hypothetical protein [Yersinia intermedia]|uniref:hypothetical protein n=1 Tax=Yersinia intermedia TaxID=631 RepID=UPI0030D53338
MKYTLICRSGADAQRAGVWSVATLACLILMAISPPMTWAKVSDITGPINGRAPTATGALEVMFPNGTTAITNNAVVNITMKPIDFLVSTTALTLQDLDGDTGLSTSINTSEVTWDWKDNGVALTPAQLAAPFSTNFLGKTLTVAASAPVTVSSLTGVPKQNTPATFNSATYTLVVPATLPVVRVNGVSFAMDSGFPKTGFNQAQFQFWMNGTSAAENSNYTFAADPLAPWVKVDPRWGIVIFTGTPTSAQTVNLTITDNRGGPATTFSFRVGTWFINNGTNYATAAGADSYCASKTGYATPSYLNMTNAASLGAFGTRAADGRLWDEWGNIGDPRSYSAGWSMDYYWARETVGENRVFFGTRYGDLNLNRPIDFRYVACSRTL